MVYLSNSRLNYGTNKTHRMILCTDLETGCTVWMNYLFEKNMYPAIESRVTFVCFDFCDCKMYSVNKEDL